MVKYLATAVCVFCVVMSYAQQRGDIKKLTGQPGMKNASVGISVKRVSDGKMLAEYNPELSLKPASVTKLFATVFALKEKGKDYRYRTDVFYSNAIDNGVLNGDIVVDATGDPVLDSYYFPGSAFVGRLAAAIERAGIKKINGRILIRGKIKTRALPGSWPWEDLSNYYAAEYMPFNYRDNSYTVKFKSGNAGTLTKLLSVVPPQPGIRFENQVMASAAKGDDAWIFGGPYSDVMCIKGSIPQNRPVFEIKGAMNRPADSFTSELTDLLKQKGIMIAGQELKNNGEVKLYSAVSPAIGDIVYYTNKVSVNLFAEALGYLATSGDYNEGVCSLLKKAGINASGVILKDACGLSPQNAVPAGVFTDLLVWAKRDIGDAFVRSLPVAGGTDKLDETNKSLNSRLNAGLNGYYGGNQLLLNNLRAKTGSFAGVRCLAGYITDRSGELLAFTILINNYTCSSAILQQGVRDFLLSVINN